MIFSVLVLWGIISFVKIPVELRPNASFNNISIIANVRGGMPPEEVEKLITIPIEEAVSTIAGLKTLNSTSKEGQSNIVLSFPPETDMDMIGLEVSERFDAIKNDLPKEMERPIIAKYEQNDVPVIILTLGSDNLNVEELRRIADKNLKPFLQRVNNVANVEVAGGREQKIVIEADEDKLLARGLSLDRVTDAIGRNNMNILAGDVKMKDKQLLIRAEAQFKDLDEVKNTIVTSRYGTDIVRVRDVADVSYEYMESNNYSSFNSKPVVSIYIQKESESNTVKVCKDVVKEVENLKITLPKDVTLQVIDNQSEFIEEVINKVTESLLYGALLAIGVLYFYLRDIRATLIIGAAIPLSVIITMGFRYWTGNSLNVLSLSGLALGIGMLVDNSIVVLEIASQKMEAGLDRIKASIEGPESVMLSLVASTCTTLIVFLPIVFVNPQTKILYGGMAMAVAFSLISSLFVSISLVPVLFSRGSAQMKSVGFIKDLGARYRTVLFGGFRYRYFVVGAVLMLLLGSVLYLALMDKDIFGGADEGKFTVFVELQSGARVDISKKLVEEVENKLKVIPEIESYSSRVDGWSSKIFYKLKKIRAKQTPQVLDEVRKLITGMGQKEKAFVYTSSGESVGVTEIVINLFGYSYPQLLELSSKLSEEIKKIGGFFDFKLRYKPGRPERVIKINRERASLLGFSVQEVADAIHARVRGIRATKIFQNGKEIETIIRLKEENRKTFEEVSNIQLVNKQGRKVNLAELADFKEDLAPSEIWHQDKMRMIQVSCSTTSYSIGTSMELIGGLFKYLKFPEDYFAQFGGDFKEMKKTYSNLQVAVVIMLLLVFMLLASLFESYHQPIIIMITVPLSLIGASIFLGFSRFAMTIGVLMGIIILGGIVVNNAIIFFDSFNHLRTKNHGFMKSIVIAGTSRLRPILMTTSTTILGLMPLAFDKSSASNMWAPLAITVIGGLSSSTVLTLVVIPSVTVIFKDFEDMYFAFINKGAWKIWKKNK